MISFFRAPIKNITPQAQVSILQIYKYITSDYAKEVTERLRSMSDHAAARRYKGEMLDYVTFSGCFSSRRTGDLIEHSGFLCFDIDKIESEDRLQEIKSQLINDEELHTVLCFRSPSGNGLKWVVEVPDRYWLGVSHTDNILHTELTDNTEDAVASPAENRFINDFEQSEKSNSVSSVHSVREKENSVRNKNNSVREDTNDVIVKNHRVLYERIRGYLFEQYGIETDHTSDIARPCYLCHDDDAYYDPPTFKDNPASRFLKVGTLGSSVRTSIASSNLCKSDERLLTKSKQRIEKELNNQSDLCNLWETPHSEGVNSVRNNNSVRISSTRGINISRHETDTTSTLRITLRPDTVYVPYTTHIRSDTIVAPDPTVQAKLTTARWKMALLIILMLLIIVYRLRPLLYR